MPQLPSHPFKKNAEGSPKLSNGNEFVAPEGVAPRLALPTTPPQETRRMPVAPPALPVYTPAPVTPPTAATASPVQAPVAVQEQAVVEETPELSIENLRFEEVISESKLEEIRRREVAINNLPASLKKAIHELFELITDDTSSEVVMNGPKTIGFRKAGQRYITDIDLVDTKTYHSVINSFLLPLTNTEDRIGTTPSLIEGQLVIPDNENPTRRPLVARVHVVAPPVLTNAVVTISKKARNRFTIDDMVNSGSMTRDMGQFLKDLARGRVTIVTSGLSGAGKTTLLEALSREFDVNDRVILIEDVEELSLPLADVVELKSHIARPHESTDNNVTLEWLVRQANRMRGDRIIVGEVRGSEMAEFLTAANSGADGSMTTVHADTPQKAINKMMNLSLKAPGTNSEASVLRDIASTVQVIIQMARIDGRHIVSQIEEVSDTVNKNTLGIQTSTIFKFNRTTGMFEFENRPSDEFLSFLKQRGVDIKLPTGFARGY
jgi:Flp pilus assembly CpaF family ATPase